MRTTARTTLPATTTKQASEGARRYDRDAASLSVVTERVPVLYASERRRRLATLARHLVEVRFFDGCVYVLLLEDEAVYVGRTMSLGLRLDRHRRSERPPGHTPAARRYAGAKGAWFDVAVYVPTPRAYLAVREAFMIAHLCPRYNAPVLMRPEYAEHARHTLQLYDL